MSAGTLLALRVGLLLLYPLLAHLASARQDGTLAAIALADIAVILLLEPLLRLRVGAWALMVAVVPLLWWLAQAGHALLPLLLVPVVFLALVGWLFARTLRAGQVPLISRIVVEMEQTPFAEQAPDLRRYTRRLTAAWAVLLLGLAVLNLVLALIAVPDGVLASLGIMAPVTVTEQQWAWIANTLSYGGVGGFFALEFAYRERHFPGRYTSFWDFLSKLARLGPSFWRGVMR